MWKTVELRPADFGCHKIFHPAFQDDLRQRSRVTKHIRQPQQIHLLSKFLANEPPAKQKLAHQ